MTLSIQEHRLACGMPMLLVDMPGTGVATADVWVRTGAADEPLAASGVSHFLEHMLFKGTERWGVGEIERAIEAVGGVTNAATSYDYTHYYVTLPSTAIARAIGLLVEMVRAATIDERELEKERLVILEEYRRKQDHPTGVLYETLYQRAFAEGRYARTVIGTEETIRAIDRPAMVDYYCGRYTPDNMVLIVAGDFRPREAIDAAETATAGFTTRALPSPSGRGRYGTGSRLHVEKPTGGELYVTFAFPAPGWDAPEKIMPISFAQCLLGQGRAARLYQALKERDGLCSSIGVSYPTHRSDSLLVIVASCLPGQLDALREGVVRELREFLREGIARDDEQRARRLLAGAHRFSLETSGSVASQLGYAWATAGNLRCVTDYLTLLDATTTDEVLAAARDILGDADLPDRMIKESDGPAPATA